VKFLDLIQFKEVFEKQYVMPKRKTKLGCYRMVLGILLLIFIGFQRLGHFVHIQRDAMLCGILKVSCLPVVSTFWRYLRSLTIVQSQSLLKVMAVLRSRVWQICGYQPKGVSVDLDTTVSTVYGETEGSRKGHNTKHRGRKGLRPVLGFIHETREYLCGTLRRGTTIREKEVETLIRRLSRYLPDCVEKVLVRADGEFISWKSVLACEEMGFSYIFGARSHSPVFPKEGWYKHGEYEYNECLYQPHGWKGPCRFVAMRLEKEKKGEKQLPLLEEMKYVYRIFATNRKGQPHKVISEYDKRADVENSIGEAQREGILAIPSKRFQANHAFFQIVMLAYNLWRWIKQLGGEQQKEFFKVEKGKPLKKVLIVNQKIRLTRLKLLYVGAKVAYHSNRDRVYYSIHEMRAIGLIDFLNYLDIRRREPVEWKDPPLRTRRLVAA
jgi:hypothetical protein